MRKVISLIGDYFFILFFGTITGIFLFLQYYSSTNLIAGKEIEFSGRILLYGLFNTLQVIFLIAPMCIIFYKIRHRSNPKASFITFSILCLANWLLFYPVTLTLINQSEKKSLQTDAIQDSTQLSQGYFRKSLDKVFYFNHPEEDNFADILMLHDTKKPEDFAKEMTLYLSEKSDFAKENYPYRDPVVKESLANTPVYIINMFESIKFQAARAWNYGLISWICFCSIGLALCSSYCFLKLSSWRLVNALFAITATTLIIWFNDFYFSSLATNFREFMQNLFYESGKLSFFIEKGIEFPLMILNLLISLIFIACGILIAILRKQEDK